jgi:hypothetical protein
LLLIRGYAGRIRGSRGAGLFNGRRFPGLGLTTLSL